MFKDPALLQELNTVGFKKSFSPGHVFIHPGDTFQYVPIVLKGTLRIVLQNPEGNERFLYHLFPGDTCALSLTCCQANKKSEIKAVVEDESELLLIPTSCLDKWMCFPEWKKYVSETQANRFSELLETIELIAFSKMDEQLWNYLIKRTQANGSKLIKITHQEIATELNSPREVITRLLHQLQEKKRITLTKNGIEVNFSV